MKICRDDLRYTDDVIATLQSDNPRWYIAKALNIPIEDVEYHYEEVRGMKHSGAVMTINNMFDDDGWPTAPEWYAERTRRQIAQELGKSKDRVIRYVRKNELTVKREPTRKRINWPTKPEWYASRTCSMISEELRVTVRAVRDHMLRNGFKSRRQREWVTWPTSPEWYAKRTKKQIADELNIRVHSVYMHITRNGYTVRKPENIRRITWPTDPQWYAVRTIKEIAEELAVTLGTARSRLYRKDYPYKIVRSYYLTQ